MHHPIQLIEPGFPPSNCVCDLTSDTIYCIDLDGQLSYLNQAGHASLCLDPGAAYGRPWNAFIHEDDRQRFRTAVERAFRAESTVLEVDARLVSTLGAVIQCVHRLRVIPPEQNVHPARILGYARDVSEVRRLEDQLHQSQRLETIGLLAGGIAHDFNNMLAAILGYAELMIEDKDPLDPDCKGLQHILTSTERAAALVRQILLFTRKSGATLKPVKISAILDETLLIVRRTVPRTIRVTVENRHGDDFIIADAGRIQQALINICLNARDAMPNGGDLKIEVARRRGRVPTNHPFSSGPDASAYAVVQPRLFDLERDSPPANQVDSSIAAGAGGIVGPESDEFVCVRVEDTGEGMDSQVMEQIWAPFFTTKAEGAGTGLGLAVVQQIVKAHRGFATVESRPGEGSAFSLFLPVSSPEEIEAQLIRSEPPGGEETILVVDDEPVLLDLLKDILRPKGYHVIAAESSRQALDYVEAVGDKINLVISDNMMPEMTGRELAANILAKYPDMRILVCSGFSPTRESELGGIDYVTSYVQKPYQRRDLLARVRQSLDTMGGVRGERTRDGETSPLALGAGFVATAIDAGSRPPPNGSQAAAAADSTSEEMVPGSAGL